MKKIIFLILLILVGCFYFYSDNRGIANDFYEQVNREFLNKNYLGDDEYIYNTFTLAQEESNKVRDAIIKDVINGDVSIDNEVSKNINFLYNNVLDINERNSVSINPLSKYIELVMGSKNISELIRNSVVVENQLGVDIFTRVVVDKDFKDNSKIQVYLYPVTFAFGTVADYYVDEDYITYMAYIKRAIIQLLMEYGYNKKEARMVSSEIISFYKDIGSNSKLSNSYEDVTSYYNVVDSSYLNSVYNVFDVTWYLNERGINEDKYSLVDEGQYKKINEYLSDEYLMIWKKVILVEILSSYASYVDEDYYNIVNELNNKITGTDVEVDYKEDAVSLVGNVFSDEIDKLYDEKVITDLDKEYLKELFSDIKNYFGKMLNDNTWLSEDTKKLALVKLDKMKVYVGLDGYNNNLSQNIVVSGDSLVENVISINKSNYDLSLKRLEEEIDVRELGMSEVNAYYSPLDNAVYIPSSVMFLMKSDASYYEKLGTIGMVIAHEVTHGFDYNGSLFDSDGNLNNWWSDADRENYTKLKDKVSDYYSKIEVLDGKYIDGDKTVNENIADMGALKVISGVAVENGASMDDLKEMYSSFASFWKCQVNDEYAKLLLLNDSHSPNKYRVNAVLSLTDNFYDVYNIYPWNDMYVFSKKRVSVW